MDSMEPCITRLTFSTKSLLGGVSFGLKYLSYRANKRGMSESTWYGYLVPTQVAELNDLLVDVHLNLNSPSLSLLLTSLLEHSRFAKHF